MKTEITLEEAIKKYQEILPDIISSIYRYVEKGIPTGGFLRSVLSNDLRGAFSRADRYSKTFIGEIIILLENEVPDTCWGSPEKVATWLDSFKKEESKG